MKKLSLILTAGLLSMIALSQCHQEKTPKRASIRGKIVNPKTDKVVISRDFLMLHADTLKLVGENEVNGKIDTPVEGLYILFIYPEFQTIYLKPDDSLAFHLNINEFDESLSFSGSIGFENNLLMDLFLENEKESSYFYKHNFQFTPDQFLQKIDSFKILKKQITQDVYQNYEQPTKKFKNIVQLVSNSMDYSLKEAYVQKNANVNLPESYFDYTKILKKTLADPNVIYMYAFADAYLSRKIHKNQNPKSLNLEIAQHINQDIKDQHFKNNLLTRYCDQYIRKHHIKKTDTVIKTYFKGINKPNYLNYCKQLMQSNRKTEKGASFPDLKLIDKQHQTTQTASLFKHKKVCLSFWDLKQHKNFISNLRKLQQYKKNYPNIMFIVININQDNFEQWALATPDNKDINFYRLVNRQSWQDIRPFHLSQVYLIDNGIIKASRKNMYQPNFNETLKAFADEK